MRSVILIYAGIISIISSGYAQSRMDTANVVTFVPMLKDSSIVYKGMMDIKDIKDMFKVKKIKSDKGVYLLYLERADTLYKAFVLKENGEVSGEKIKKGRTYLFDLQQWFPYMFPSGLYVDGDQVNVISLPDDIFVTIERDKERLLWKLYFVRNLKGLYLQKVNPN